MQFRTIYTVELECILNGLPWRMLALSECFTLHPSASDRANIGQKTPRVSPTNAAVVTVNINDVSTRCADVTRMLQSHIAIIDIRIW